jgi:tRNA (guanine37-N1)-methyltransferase
MVIHILTLFPEVFEPVFENSILKRAQGKALVKINLYNLRNWATDKHGTVDDRPYGGGAGMILKIEPVYRAIKDIKNKANNKKLKVFLLSAKGETFNQALAKKLSDFEEVLLICGHYEGFDERIRHFVDGEISIGDYILTGGEIAAMVVADATIRLLPGVLKRSEATEKDSFSPGLAKMISEKQKKEQDHLLEYPQYTRPKKFQNLSVPEVLLSGDHNKIQEWQKKHIRKKDEA